MELRRLINQAGLRIGRWYRTLDEDAVSVVLAALVGLATAALGIAFHWTIAGVSHLTGIPGHADADGVWQAPPPLVLVLVPVIGGLIVGLLRRWLDPRGEGFGVGHVVEAIAAREGNVPRQRTLLALLGSIVTLGTGGSAGPEGPIVQVGAGVGSEIGRSTGAPSNMRRILVGCGAAAGIATLFNAPIGGVLFVVEVITEGFGVLSLGPILISAVTATAIRHAILGEAPPFGVLLIEPLPFTAIVLAAVLGIGCGYIGRWLLTGWQASNRFARKTPLPLWARPMIGGLIAGLCGLVAPRVMGIGYEFIADLFANPVSFGITTLLIILLLKVVATGATLVYGGAGGVFAPSLFLGATLGVLAGQLMSLVGLPIDDQVLQVLAIIGMAALMSAILHCPMTALLLVFELTRNYELIVPTMAATVAATWISRRGQRYSIFLMELAERGVHYRRGSDLSVLRRIKIVDLLETDAIEVRESATFDEILEVVKHSSRNYFPVLDDQDHFCGIIFLNDLRQHLFSDELRHLVRASDMMNTEVLSIGLDDSMDEVLRKFDTTGAWSLPVVFLGRYRGMISRSRIQVAYRNALITETHV